MKFPSRLAGILMLALLPLVAAGPVTAKTIVEGATLSQNKIFIRTDGLACYFCAYGLERTFKKTGRIAAFDMHMKEGIVEVIPLRGEPLVGARQLNQYVHDAGFTPRWIRVELTGRFSRVKTALVFDVAETGERLPVGDDEGQALKVPAEDLGHLVRVKARGVAHEGVAFRLTQGSYAPLEQTADEGQL